MWVLICLVCSQAGRNTCRSSCRRNQNCGAKYPCWPCKPGLRGQGRFGHWMCIGLWVKTIFCRHPLAKLACFYREISPCVGPTGSQTLAMCYHSAADQWTVLLVTVCLQRESLRYGSSLRLPYKPCSERQGRCYSESTGWRSKISFSSPAAGATASCFSFLLLLCLQAVGDWYVLTKLHQSPLEGLHEGQRSACMGLTAGSRTNLVSSWGQGPGCPVCCPSRTSVTPNTGPHMFFQPQDFRLQLSL